MSLTILQGDALKQLATLSDESVQCCNVTEGLGI